MCLDNMCVCAVEGVGNEKSSLGVCEICAATTVVRNLNSDTAFGVSSPFKNISERCLSMVIEDFVHLDKHWETNVELMTKARFFARVLHVDPDSLLAATAVSNASAKGR